jgi:hypothetical protein
MPSLADIQDTENQINQYCTQYAVDFFSNQRGRTILLNMLGFISALLGQANISATLPEFVASTQFTNATDCPLTAFNGVQIQIYWQDTNRFLIEGTDWTPLSGGGFTILISGFNSASATYTFVVFS